MTKKYTKPGIMFQQMNIEADLSAGCSIQVSFEEFACPILIPEWGETVYQNNTGCDWGNDEGFVCYHVPTAASNVFAS